ncbi:CCHC-type domain-containing protein [Trichonephila clavipes]|nr:CCHC-type domain-containing protein [Trichonephila clavipes]
MPTEQEAKPAVVTPSLQQWRSPSTFRGAHGEDPLKWLKEYDRVANFNKWDDMMCLANVYFFLDGTARDSGESTQSYIQSVLGLCQEVNPLMKEDEKVSHLMKGVAEDIYQALLTREINDTASFIKWCNYIEDMKQKRVGRPRFERLPNVVPKRSFKTKLKGFWPQCQQNLQKTRPRPTYAAVTRKYRAPVQKFPPEPRKTDVWRTADNRPVCFHCGRPGHVMRYCRERKAVFDNSSKPPTELRRHPRRHIADLVSRQAVERGKSKESDLPRSRFWGIVFVISDKYRRFLKKVLFADAKSVMLKVADGNFVRPIGKCVLRVRINNRELPFEFIVLSHCSHDVILGWDFLEASQAVIDCGQNELVLEDICRDSTAPDAWNLYATRDYTLKPHSLTRITVSGYQTRGDINVSRRQQTFALREKYCYTVHGIHIS